MPRHLLILCFCFAAALAALGGCADDPTGPQEPEATGGETFVVDYDTFVQAISPILREEGCDAGGDCHGGGIRGTFALSPAQDPDPDFDYEQASLQVRGDSPGASPLLVKPLAPEAGGRPHAVSAFESTDDPHYQAILGWIESGVYR